MSEACGTVRVNIQRGDVRYRHRCPGLHSGADTNPMSEARGKHMRECERLFGLVRGGEIRAMVVAATGELCPCDAGRACPLVAAVAPEPVAPAAV